MQVMDEFERVGFNPSTTACSRSSTKGSRETQGTIADALNVDRSTLVGLLDTLEENELIERRRDRTTGAGISSACTAAGRRQLASFRKLVQRVEDEILAPLDEDDRAGLPPAAPAARLPPGRALHPAPFDLSRLLRERSPRQNVDDCGDTDPGESESLRSDPEALRPSR